jgi:ParB family transcriptional regulator, chromosome partitioning protein
MSVLRRRGLLVDDPLAAGEERSPAAPATAGAEVAGRLWAIPIGRIHANPGQPRKRFDEAALAALADSIRERGVLQPVIVRPVGDSYELVAGERRWRAAELAGEATIPALVDDALDQAGSLELALIENIVREDLSPIEQARTFSVLLDDLRMTSAVLATRIGRSRADIANTMRLLDLPDEVVAMIDSGRLTKGHGKVLLTEPDHHRRLLLARQAAERGWSVRALEGEITRATRPASPRSSPDEDQCAVATRLEEAITRAIGCEATAKPHRNGFQILLDHPAADRLARALGADMGAL